MKIHIDKNISTLIVRLIIGAVFIVHGWIKVSDMPHIVGYFGSMGFAPFFAYLVGYAEVIGGIMLVIGLYAELAALVLGIIMVVAVFVSRKAGFSGYELPLTALAGLVGILGTGAGKYAIRSGKHSN